MLVKKKRVSITGDNNKTISKQLEKTEESSLNTRNKAYANKHQ